MLTKTELIKIITTKELSFSNQIETFFTFKIESPKEILISQLVLKQMALMSTVIRKMKCPLFLQSNQTICIWSLPASNLSF